MSAAIRAAIASAPDVEAAPDVSFGAHRATSICPHCGATTSGRRECPACQLSLDDATLERYAAAATRRTARATLIAAFVAGATLCFVLGLGFGYSWRGRASTVDADRSSRLTDLALRERWRSMTPAARSQWYGSELRAVYRPEVFPIRRLILTRMDIPDQPAVRGVPDLEVVLADERAWRGLDLDQKQLMLATFSLKHQAYLELNGSPDTTRFAVSFYAARAEGAPLRLALRDRVGKTYVR
jgi:hypothetical protein